MMDSSKALMLVSAVALYKAVRFISASLRASRPVSVNGNNDVVPISMAASSSDINVTPPITKHHVFLSFRGEDTRGNFTSHLYEALCKANIKTYIDYKLRKGEQISPILLRAIEESEISVVIFSKDYASSTWCLDELVKIMECKDKYGRVVIPVFYNVDPSDVRKQRGSFENAFAKLEHRFKKNKEKVKMWRDALNLPTGLSGFDSKKIRPESELVKGIVKDILSKLNYTSSCHFEGLVGIHHHIEKIEEFLSEVCIVGIWGMGGIGKTTLAKAVFQKSKANYESFSFVENVRDQLKRIGLDKLQEKCLKELLKDEDMDTYSIRSNFVKDRLQRKKILLVLDDVDNSLQVEDLTNVCDWFGEGSRIIVTSRDMQVLKNATASRTYHVQTMNSHDALHLFSLKAFKKNGPTNESYTELSEWVVDYCQGNPLALVVLGCFLCGRRKEEWESALEKLKQAPHNDIFNVLRLSFDGLDDKQKDLFLDLAYLFRETYSYLFRETPRLSMDFIRDYYDSSVYIEISVLKDRSLISVDETYRYIEMHDLVKKMGQEISRQQLTAKPGKPIRLWRHDDVYNFFNSNKGTEAIQYISLDICKTKGIFLKANIFEMMHHLKFFKFYKSSQDQPSNVYVFDGLNYLAENLIYFHWEDYPLSYVPLSCCAESLVELVMYDSRLQQLWDGDQHFPKLRTIGVSGSEHLIRLPDLSQAPNIHFISALGCTNLAEIYSSSVLPKLGFLMLPLCENLRHVSIGNKIKRRSLGLVAVHKFLDLIDFSFKEVTIKLFTTDDHKEISGFQFKVVSAPFIEISKWINNMGIAEMKLSGQYLTSLLPFVSRVHWFDITQFDNFKKHFGVSLDSYSESYGYRQSEVHTLLLSYETEIRELSQHFLASDQRGIGEKLMTELECYSSRSSKKLMRELDCSSSNGEKLVTEEKCYSSNESCSNGLTRVPNNINRWSLLTQLTLQKSDIRGSGACSSNPGFSTLKSLAEANWSSLQPIINLTISLDTTGSYNTTLLIYHNGHSSFGGFNIEHSRTGIKFRFGDPKEKKIQW